MLFNLTVNIIHIYIWHLFTSRLLCLRMDRQVQTDSRTRSFIHSSRWRGLEPVKHRQVKAGSLWTGQPFVAGPTYRDKRPSTPTMTQPDPSLDVLGLWQEAGEPGEKTRRRTQTQNTERP